jgi:thioesterase domain-containing protein
VAHEVACQLEADGEQVGFLGIVDLPAPGEGTMSLFWSAYRYLLDNAGGTGMHLNNFVRTDARGRARTLARAPGFLAKKALRMPVEVSEDPVRTDTRSVAAGEVVQWIDTLPEPLRSVSKANAAALRRHVPKTYGGAVTVFMSSFRVKADRRAGRYESKYGWKRLARGSVRLYVIDGTHETIIRPGPSKAIAGIVRGQIRC